jgi:hypothetical protein
MWPIVAASWRAFNVLLEGEIPHPYLDVYGLVTVGMGNLIDPLELALPLPWVLADGRPAPTDTIVADWHALKARQDLSLKSASYAATLTHIRLTPASITALCKTKLQLNHNGLLHHFPGLNSYPADAQLAVHSMAWAMGSDFPVKFPAFKALFAAQDFVRASRECAIKSDGNAGVIPRNYLNMAHLIEADIQRIENPSVDRSVLYGPGTLPALKPWAAKYGIKFSTPIGGHSSWNVES